MNHFIHNPKSRGLLSIVPILGTLLLTAACAPQSNTPAAPLRFAVSFPAAKSDQPLDGRILLLVSNDGSAEPRNQISDGATTQLIFGLDVDGWKPGTAAIVDASAFGYPLQSIAEIPAGDYFIQALLNRYEKFTRSDGHTVKLPPDKGEGQRWNAKPGNLFSTPLRMRIDPGESRIIPITLDQEIPPLTPAPDTKYIKHIKIRSELLSKF